MHHTSLCILYNTYYIIILINLQDLRMSPIPSLRNRHKAKYYKEPGGRLHGMCPSQVFIFSWLLTKTCKTNVSTILSVCIQCFSVWIVDAVYSKLIKTFQVRTKASRRVSGCIGTTVSPCTGAVTTVTERNGSELGYWTSLRRARAWSSPRCPRSKT